MRNLFILLLLLAACGQPEPAAEIPKKAVFIILDGIPADVLEQVETPVLDEIAGEKGYTRSYVGGESGAYSETPTISAPGYMDLLTAAWANKHNVWGNSDQKPNYHYHNIFRIVEEHDTTLQTAIFSTWLDNRTVLVGEGNHSSGEFRFEHIADGFELDTIRFPHDTSRQYILKIDEWVTDEAARTISEKGPDLSWVYLEYTDDIGHKYGDSEEFYQAIRTADAQVGRIWEAVKKRQAQGEDWMVVITTDHGRDSISGKDHGGQSLRERTTWMVTNAAPLNQRFTADDPPVVDITPSILHHMGITPPEAVWNEMDGISFLGDVSLDHFKAQLKDRILQVSWNAITPGGEAQILLATANNFKTGGQDSYQEIATVPVSAGKFERELSEEQQAAFESSGVLKVLIKAPHNRANYWISGTGGSR